MTPRHSSETRLAITDTGTGSRFTVRVIPRARTATLGGFRQDALVCRVTEAPVDGAANAALERLLAAHLDVPKSSVRIVRGERAREKTVEIDGLAPTDLLARLRVEP